MILRSITIAALALAAITLLSGSILAAVFVFIGSWLGLAAVAFAFLVVVSYMVDPDQEQEDDDPFYRRVSNLYVEVLLMALQVRVKAYGLEKIPKDSRFLLVCNHQSPADPGVLFHYLRHSQLAFISKKENRDMFCIGRLMQKVLCQFIDRDDDRQALQVILRCIRILKDDKASIAVFPEGGILSEDGVFKIAQKAQVPIVICTIRNTRHVIHNGMRLKKSNVELKLVEIIPAESLKGRTAVDISNQVYRIMADDLGPELIAKDN